LGEGSVSHGGALWPNTDGLWRNANTPESAGSGSGSSLRTTLSRLAASLLTGQRWTTVYAFRSAWRQEPDSTRDVIAAVVSLRGAGSQNAAGSSVNLSGGGSGGSGASSSRVVPAVVSMAAARTRLTLRLPLPAPETISTLSPRRTFTAVPTTVTTFVSGVSGGCGWSSCGRMALSSGRPVIASIVSNVCGRSPGAGMLCTRVPSGTGTSPVPSVSSTVNARCAEAAIPGRGT
jgi:hypothetical protein